VAVGKFTVRYIAVQQILAVLCCGPLYRSVYNGIADPSSAVLWAIVLFGT
jgi:hypothetical protein